MDLKVILTLAVWLFTVGVSYLIGDIAFGSDIGEYMEVTSLTAVYFAAGLVIAAVYGCWYLIRRENKWLDIAAPMAVLIAWGLTRRKMLYMGGKGVIYSIGYELRKEYGLRAGVIDIEYVDARALSEFIVYATAVFMFFAAYMIFRYESLMLAIAMTLLLMACGAALSVDVSPQGVILVVVSMIVGRYVMVSGGRRPSAVWNIAVPAVCLAVCLIAAMFIYEKAYDKGVSAQPQLLEFVDNMEYMFTGADGRGYSNYYKIDDKDVNPTDDVIDEITREEKPVGNLYVTLKTFVTYDDGVWRVRDAGYSHDNELFTEYDGTVFSRLAEDVKKLAAGRNEFSTEFAESVKEYIRNRMSYTTSPAAFDEEWDPVMYALYQGHEGYCIHFASASAIAFRTVGIASRYDTGYVVPSAAWTVQEDGMYHAYVLEKYSHAWTEVYNEESGAWLIIDATPMDVRADALGIEPEPEYGSGVGEAGTGQEAEQPGENDTPEDVTSHEDGTEEDNTGEASSEADSEAGLQPGAYDGDEAVTESPAGEIDSGTPEDSSGDTGKQSGGASGKNGTGMVSGTDKENGDAAGAVTEILAVTALLLVLIAALELRRRVIVSKRRRRFMGRNRIRAIYELSESMYEMLEFAGMADDTTGNDMSYARAVSEKCDIIEDGEFERFIECVQAAVYGQIAPDDVQMKSAARLYNKIRAYAYLSLDLKGKVVWRYVKCYDTSGHVR